MPTDSQSLLEQAKCFLCYGVSQAEAMELALLQTIAQQGIAPGDIFMTGMIVMWSGTIAAIPAGWQLCDGTNGTPDLRDKFVVGARQDSGGVAKTNLTGALTQVGGSITHSHTNTDPSHTHSLQADGAGTVQAGAGFNAATTASQASITVNPTDAPQPYFALAYIMKL